MLVLMDSLLLYMGANITTTFNFKVFFKREGMLFILKHYIGEIITQIVKLKYFWRVGEWYLHYCC